MFSNLRKSFTFLLFGCLCALCAADVFAQNKQPEQTPSLESSSEILPSPAGAEPGADAAPEGAEERRAGASERRRPPWPSAFFCAASSAWPSGKNGGNWGLGSAPNPPSPAIQPRRRSSDVLNECSEVGRDPAGAGCVRGTGEAAGWAGFPVARFGEHTSTQLLGN